MGKAAVLAIAGAFAALLLKKTHPETAAVVVLAAGAVLLASAMEPLKQIVQAMLDLGQDTAMPDGVMDSALKLAGVSLIAQFGSQLCKDAQQEGLAQKVEFFGRCALTAMCAPVLIGIVGLVKGFAP